MPRGLNTSLRLSCVAREKCFQLWLEDDKIAQMGQYIILFALSSVRLPTTFFGGFCFLLMTKTEVDKMKKFINSRIFLAVLGTCAISLSSVAEDIAETCANGGGAVLVGVVSGHKYCKSKNAMNWWNAVAWCDALSRRLIDVNKDCVSKIIDGDIKCSDVIGSGSQYVWTMNVGSGGRVYELYLSSGRIGGPITANPGGYGAKYALCK